MIIDEQKTQMRSKIDVTKSQLDLEVNHALLVLENIKKLVKPTTDIYKVTKQQLYEDATLRSKLIEKPMEEIIMESKMSKEFEKQYSSEWQKRRDLREKFDNSNFKKDKELLKGTLKHNIDLI